MGGGSRPRGVQGMIRGWKGRSGRGGEVYKGQILRQNEGVRNPHAAFSRPEKVIG